MDSPSKDTAGQRRESAEAPEQFPKVFPADHEADDRRDGTVAGVLRAGRELRSKQKSKNL